MMALLYIILLIISFLIGVTVTLVVEWYLFNNYINSKPFVGPTSTPVVDPFEIPKVVLNESSRGKESAGAINALLQFLFQECRNTKRVRKWFRDRLRFELEELLTRTTTGRLFESIALRDLNLGSHLPAIHSIEVKTINLDPVTKLIDEVEISLDIEYNGGFQLSIDANMRLSKMAHVSVKVNELSGLGRLKFSRYPYTHWCFSFYTDPTLNLTVESQFQGRSLPQVNSIIASQAEIDSSQDGEEPPRGNLEVAIIEVSRITEVAGVVFCTVAIDNTAWIELIQTGSTSYLTVDISIMKQQGQHLGIQFKQEFVPDKYQVCVIVDSIQNSAVADLKEGDIIVMADGKSVSSLPVLHKILKQGPNKIVLRIERKMKSIIQDDKISNETVEQFGLRNRGGCGDKTDSDSSNPPSSSDSPAKRPSSGGSPDHSLPRFSISSEQEFDPNRLQFFSTKDVAYSKVIHFNESFNFQVLPEHKYMNVSVWHRDSSKNNLLGHISLPLSVHCCSLTPGHHVVAFSLLPPNPAMANSLTNNLSSHPGFEPCLCFGDVLLAFSFTNNTSSSSSTTAASISNPPVTVTPSPTSSSIGSEQSNAPGIPHDFIRTHFEKVTQCGFCFKKIWLKDALQCQGCLMSCHKKCAVKAQAGPGCARSIRRQSVQPEIITTSVDENNSTTTGRSLGSLLVNVANKGLKRAGSATTLAPPGLDENSAGNSVSLPPSPNHSPSPSRKTSLVEEGLFCLSTSSGEEINQALEVLLSRPHDEGVMDIAKASGKMLFADLPSDLRKVKIDEMMSKLKDAIDAESHNHQALQREEQSLENPAAKAKVAFLVGKSEERLQALAVLMLHCCAGLQDHQETQ
ncbi:PDZ domain containing 8 isoform X2 [Rhodnius prolixus]|uniref:PDZ domain containing 8 isoform X2 n=1 Tax=Rhodnius prolixus TaxID=13249 RepID=UPI003D18D167